MHARVGLDERAQLSRLEGVGSVLQRSATAVSQILTSKLFCIIPWPNQPRSPPFLALEQSLSTAAILANSEAIWSGGSDWRRST